MRFARPGGQGLQARALLRNLLSCPRSHVVVGIGLSLFLLFLEFSFSSPLQLRHYFSYFYRGACPTTREQTTYMLSASQITMCPTPFSNMKALCCGMCHRIQK